MIKKLITILVDIMYIVSEPKINTFWYAITSSRIVCMHLG